MKRLSLKSGRGICITRLYKHYVLSLSTDKWGPIVQWKVNKLEINKNLKLKKGVGITIKSQGQQSWSGQSGYSLTTFYTF